MGREARRNQGGRIMTYNYIFDTLAQYTAAKSARGDIYNALRTSQYLSRSAVSMIRETGQVVVDSMNFIDAKETLAVGDILLYRAADQSFYALKDPGTWTTTPGTKAYSLSDLTAVGFVPVGRVYYRDGVECIIGNPLQGTYVFSTLTTFPEGIVPFGVLTIKVSPTGTMQRARGILNAELASRFTLQSTVFDGIFPVKAADWDAALADGSTITYSIGVTEYTVTPSRYNGTYMDFVNERMLAVYPDNRPGSLVADMNGKKNTKALVESGYSVPGAEAAYAFGIEDVPGCGAGAWWLPSAGEGALIAMSATRWDGPYMGSYMTSTLRSANAYVDILAAGGLYERSLNTLSVVLAITKFRIV